MPAVPQLNVYHLQCRKISTISSWVGCINCFKNSVDWCCVRRKFNFWEKAAKTRKLQLYVPAAPCGFYRNFAGQRLEPLWNTFFSSEWVGSCLFSNYLSVIFQRGLEWAAFSPDLKGRTNHETRVRISLLFHCHTCKAATIGILTLQAIVRGRILSWKLPTSWILWRVLHLSPTINWTAGNVVHGDWFSKHFSIYGGETEKQVLDSNIKDRGWG